MERQAEWSQPGSEERETGHRARTQKRREMHRTVARKTKRCERESDETETHASPG